jgi:hypothetical protein
MKHHYDKQNLEKICKESHSYAQCLKKMNIVPSGGNYKTLKRHIKKYNIDISHFTHQSWNKGKTIGPKRDIADYLSNEQFITSWKLKNRLLKEEIFQAKCYDCENITWNGFPIPLELHHIDGNSENNNLDNLLLLCPNCHAQTDNYRAKKRK